MRTRRIALVSAVVLLAVAPACKNGEKRASAMKIEAGRESPTVVVRPGGREIVFRVELARTEAERSQGLMYRTQMAADAGMLFLFERPAPLSFWMRNTFIPLDMIFIGSDRRIVGIVESAEPRTETPRRVPGDSQYVLEVNGGLSAKLGFGAGMEVEFRNLPL